MPFQGSAVAIVTPMHADGRLALDDFERLLRAQLAAGTDAIVVAGTTGEAATLDDSEYQRLLATAMACVAGRVPVIAGAGAPSTRRVLELAGLAGREGVDALLCVTPYYLRTTQAGLQAHYECVADAADRPIVLYNVPGRTGIDMLPETVAVLAGHENIVALKEAVAGSERIRSLRAVCPNEFIVLSGDDGSCLEAMLAGASGVISVTANLVPGSLARLCKLVAESRESEARQLDQRLRPLHELLMKEPNPIPVKWALNRLGWIPPGLRLPLVQATVGLQESLGSALEAGSDLLLKDEG